MMFTGAMHRSSEVRNRANFDRRRAAFLVAVARCLESDIPTDEVVTELCSTVQALQQMICILGNRG